MDKNVEDEKYDKNLEGCLKVDGNDVNIIDELVKLDENKGEQSIGDNGDSNGDQEIKNSGQGDQNQQIDKDIVGEVIESFFIFCCLFICIQYECLV